MRAKITLQAPAAPPMHALPGLRRSVAKALVLTLLFVALGISLPLALLTGDPRALVLGVIWMGPFYLLVTLLVARGMRTHLAGCVPPRMDRRNERILVQCVEEVAIAAQLQPPPRVLVANAVPGINAFIVGFGKRSATVCVSRDAVNQLSREELEAVVAHEVAHIIHGDLLLIAFAASGTDLLTWWRRTLAGAAAGLVAFGVLQGLVGGRAHKSRLDGATRVAWLLVIGLFMLCAWLAHIAARRSYARFRRLQEFAADAGAVRLVRNPYGLARALHKTGRTLPDDGAGHGYCYEPRSARARPHDEYPSVEERVRRLLGGNSHRGPTSAPMLAFRPAQIGRQSRSARRSKPRGPWRRGRFA